MGGALAHENHGQVYDNDRALCGSSPSKYLQGFDSDNDESGIFFLANFIILGVALMLGSIALSTVYLCCQS